MAKRIGSSRRKTKHLHSKGIRQKGKLNVSKYFQDFAVGRKVYLSIEPSTHKGMFFKRFQGKTGIIKAKKGKCYDIVLKEGKKEKIISIHPIHLRGI